MSNFKKKIVTGVLATGLVCSGVFVGAMAATNEEAITAFLNYGITIKYNGEAQEFKDVTGARVYPISYNGTTYLPVRAVSGLVDLPVEWSGAENTVYLGTKVVPPLDLTTVAEAATNYSWVIRDSNELTVSGSDANMTYRSGLVFDIWNGSYSTAKNKVMYMPTKGKNTLTFTAWVDLEDLEESANVFVYDQDYNVITKFEVKPGQFVTKTLDISGYEKVAFGADSTAVTVDGILKIFEPTVENR